MNKHVLRAAITLYVKSLREKKQPRAVYLTDQEKLNFKPKSAAWRDVIYWLPTNPTKS